jgi:hypothetical protein
MLTIGRGHHETASLSMTLASNANPHVHSRNTLTEFTNVLPRSIIAGQHVSELFVQLKNVCISKRLTQKHRMKMKNKNYPLMLIYLQELEPQMVGHEKLPLLCTIDMNLVAQNKRNVFGKYIVIDFDKSPVLKLSKTHFQNLSIRITDAKGENYPLAFGPPTLIQLDVSCSNMDREFTITCMSHPWGNQLFPNNNPAEFHSQLYKTMDLSNCEVALASIAVPRHIGADSTFSMFLSLVDDTEDTFDVADPEERCAVTGKISALKNIREVLKQIWLALNDKPKLRAKVDIREPTRDAPFFFIINADPVKNLRISLNAVASRLLGWPTQAQQFLISRERSRSPGASSPAGSTPAWLQLSGPTFTNFFDLDKPFLGTTADMIMVYCDKVKTSVVGHSMVNLLSIVPVVWNQSAEKDRPSQVVYEPQHLLYREVVEGNLTDIGFSLQRGDGEVLTMMEEAENEFQQCGGTMITLRFRPKKTSGGEVNQRGGGGGEGVPQPPEKKHRYKNGPGGFYK